LRFFFSEGLIKPTHERKYKAKINIVFKHENNNIKRRQNDTTKFALKVERQDNRFIWSNYVWCSM